MNNGMEACYGYKRESTLPNVNPIQCIFLQKKPPIFVKMSSGRNNTPNYNQNNSSSSKSRRILYAGDPTSRYSTGPFSYRNPSTTARCTSSYHKFTCGHASALKVQRVAACAACAIVSPRQCTSAPILVEIPAKCINCQPSHRQEPNGDLARLTRRDRARETFEEWLGNSNRHGDSHSDD
jgi:hypothetical protein